MDISKIDKNFAVDTKIDKTGLKFYSVDEPPFRLYGVIREGDDYVRLPKAIAKTVSSGVDGLNYNTAGGRVRFVTDSKKIAIIARFSSAAQSVHMPFSVKAGVDIYIGNRFEGTFLPPVSLPNLAFESLKNFDEGEKLVTLNFPLYGSLCELFVGVEEGAAVTAAPDYKYETPVVYYGSSITQGGCASRPGMSYQAMLTRWIDCDHVNLGFSGNARGEKEIVDYMAGLDMSVFVCDYDHNAPNVEFLAATHEKMFKRIRERHPTIPVVMLSRTSAEWLGAERDKRRRVIMNTYENALRAGDKNVYFIDGSKIYGELESMATVEGCHPNDLGQTLIGEALAKLLGEILSKK